MIHHSRAAPASGRLEAAESSPRKERVGDRAEDDMSDERKSQRSEADAELEREILKERRFSLAEAIGRMAGPGAMKGESPITRLQQAAVEIENWLRAHLTDPGGGLAVVLLRDVKESELLAKSFDRPLAVLARFCRSVLGSPYLLEELVRRADVEWGQIFDERPHFQRPGSPPDADDPYTVDSVRGTLNGLLTQLPSAEE